MDLYQEAVDLETILTTLVECEALKKQRPSRVYTFCLALVEDNADLTYLGFYYVCSFSAKGLM